MSRNAAVRLSIASSVAAVLLFLGLVTQWAHHENRVEGTQIIEVTRDSDTPEIVADAPVRGSEIAVRHTPDCPEGCASAISSSPTEPADEDAAKARKAAIEWVKVKYPDAKVEGVFLLAFGKGNLYLAGADTQFGADKRRTVDVLVRRYTKRSGGQYFRAEGLEPEQAAQMRQKTDFDADATEELSSDANTTGWEDDDECRR